MLATPAAARIASTSTVAKILRGHLATAEVFECLVIITPSKAESRAPVTARLNRPPSKGDAGISNHSLVDFTAAQKFNYLDTALRTVSDSVLWNSSPTVQQIGRAH